MAVYVDLSQPGSDQSAGCHPASRVINASTISATHPDPPIVPNLAMSAGNPYAVPSVFGRPGSCLFFVTFKCSRADIFYLFYNTDIETLWGDLAIVEDKRRREPRGGSQAENSG